MNKFSTAIQVKPHHTISPEIWERFVVEYPKCSAEVRVQQDDFLVKYQSLSATMMASILEQIVCWQNFKDFYNAYQVLSKHQSLPQLRDFITDVLKIMNTMMQNLQPLEKQKLSNLKQADKYTFLSDYLRRNREFIYGKLIQPEGEEALCKLSRGIALSYYLNSQFDQNTAVQKYLNRVSKEIIIETLIKGIPRERKNLFILDDIEVVALSHIFSMPIHFYINCCERESITLTRRRIHSNNIERTTAILIELPLINRYRILFQHSENAYLKFLSDESVNKQVLDFEPLIQIQESVINFITLKYAEINHQWISKIIQIIQNQDVNLIIATQSLQFPAHFRPQIIQNIGKLGIAQSQISLFLLNFETIFKQSVEMFEQIVIQEVSKVRQQFEVYHKQKRKLSQSNQKEIQYPEEKPINQVPQTHKFLTSNSLFGNHIKPTQFQEQKRLSVVGKIEAKEIEQEIPFSDTEENVIHQVSEIIVEAKEYNTSSDEEKHNEFDYEAILKGQINNMRNSHIIQTSLHEDNLRNSHLIQNSLHDVQNEVSEEMEYASQQKQNFLRQSRSLIDSGRRSERKSSTETLNFNLNNSRNSNVQKKMSNSQILRTSQRQSYRGSLQNKNFQHNLEQSQILEVNESQLQSQFFFFECPICLESISREEDIRFIHDDHKICKLCLESWVKIKFNAGQWNFKYFSCPIQVVLGGKSVHCGQVINQEQIKQVLTPEEYRILQEKAMKRGIIDIICPNNSCQCIIKGMIPKSKDGLICPQCKQKICWVCKNCDHQGQKCPQRLEDIRQALKDERVSCCPQCLEIYMKNEGCEHVQCTNCLIDFCFSCSAPRLPIENHGGHYHRVGCQVRIPWINPITQKEVLDDEFEPDQCELCKIHQKACIRPIPLEDFQNLAHLKF